MSQLIYLDNAATTAVRPEVFEKMKPFFIENYSNPSAVYSFAGDTKEAVEKAREQIAAVLGAKAKEIYFTAGGSESDNWAIKGIAEALQEKGKHIITSKIEHHAVLHTCEYLEKHGYEVTYLDVDADGVVSPEAVEKAIDECIKKGILAEFLRKNRAEVLRVSIFEYDEEEHMRQEREESRQEGFEEGEKCGEVRIAKLIIELNRQGRTEDIVKMIPEGVRHTPAGAEDMM